MIPEDFRALEAEYDAACESAGGATSVALHGPSNPRIAPLLQAMLSARCAAESVTSRFTPPVREDHDSVAVEPAQHIGPYRILGVLGHGGSGVVYLAYESPPLKRLIALKVIHPGAATPEALQRFAIERSTLARLNHPNIVGAIASGQTTDDLPYIVMPLVAGVPITDFCRAESVSLKDRIRLFINVCHAVQHAHSNGVIHRDLKPGNILVAFSSDEPRPVIIDFGLAKPTVDQVHSARLTITGQALGTPRYMSPEQRRGQPVDARTDVFSLGVVLHDLLRAGEELAVVEQEPEPDGDEPERWPPPSRFAATRVSREYDWVCQRCLETDPARRYPTAAALAEDLDSAVRGIPVRAGPSARLYRALTWVRHRTLLASSVLIIALLIVGSSVLATTLALRERAQRQRAEFMGGFSSDLLDGIDPAVAQGQDRRLLIGMLEKAMAHAENDEPDDQSRADLNWMVGRAYHRLGEQLRAVPLLEGADVGAQRFGWPVQKQFEVLEARIMSLCELTKFEEALGLCPRMTALAAQAGGEENAMRAKFARMRSTRGRTGEAADLFHEMEAKLGVDHELTIRTLRFAARDVFPTNHAYRDDEHTLGKARRSLAMLRDARERAERKFKPESAVALDGLSMESWAIQRIHGYAAQKEFLVERLDEAERVLGDLNRSVILMRANLGVAYAHEGDEARWEVHSHAAEAAAPRRGGDDDELTKELRRYHIRALVFLGQESRALDWALGPDTPHSGSDFGWCAGTIKDAYWDIGNVADGDRWEVIEVQNRTRMFESAQPAGSDVAP